MTRRKDDERRASEAEPLAGRAAEGMLGPNPFIGLRPEDVAETVRVIGTQAVKQPGLVLEQEAALARDLVAVLCGNADLTPEKGDRRFADSAWQANPFYRIYLQGYLAWSRALDGFVEKAAVDERTRERIRYVMSLATEAFAPTNTLAGNPAALKKMIDSGGGSVLAGLQQMLADLVTNRGMPAQVDKQAFRVGENLAQSPGAVVFANEVLELIEYAPATAEVHARPHLIVPPQINKFYVFDLSPAKSIVGYLVRGGFRVFAVSWRNPTPEQRDWNMDTYAGALVEAIEAVREITGAADVNLHAACSGAMTAAALLGHYAARGERPVHATTLMVAVLGVNEGSQLGLFATPETIAAAKRGSAAKGVLDGREMGRVFAWLRPNDLVWNYWVNNYLMGQPPPAFDVLYWNNDTTRLPAQFHGQLLDIFAGDLLRRPGAFTVRGTPIDLGKVDCEKFVLAGITDHITPWRAVYDLARTLGGSGEFVLSSSGHVQSLLNPPGNPKARFFVNPALPATSDEWLAGAAERTGSWWDYWREWLIARSGPLGPAPAALGSTRHPPGVPAPGRYVGEA
ncbi:MAG TPA: alpha/beta fold hydrolase [Burkholderiales bacterium]|nr:alpha/beta fold hydrolase [Burkholderiales bacterium]